MEITNTEGEVYKFRGSLCADFDVDRIDLSDLIRDTLDMQDLYVFDGNNKPDVINKIVLDYHRFIKIKPKEVPKGAIWEFVTGNYTEQLIIDRETETLEHIQNIGTGCKVSHKYEIEGGIESILDNFDADEAYTQGYAGACIESCITCLVSIFSKYKGTEEFAKWISRIYNTSGEKQCPLHKTYAGFKY